MLNFSTDIIIHQLNFMYYVFFFSPLAPVIKLLLQSNMQLETVLPLVSWGLTRLWANLKSHLRL